MDSQPLESRCLLCGAERLLDAAGQGLPGVTSDSKPWPRAGVFCSCQACGHVQKRRTPQWLADIERIYADYEMYTAGCGQEQAVFQAGMPAPRSARLLESVLAQAAFPQRGRLLDVGCGNGAFLRSFGARFPQWELYGYELQESRRAVILALPGARGFLHGPFEELSGTFEAVSMLHVIEHLLDPVQTLRKVLSLLAPGGLFLVQTANLAANPFDLPVADHCSHFTLDMLERAVRLAGFEVAARSDAWVRKEIGVLAQRPQHPVPIPALTCDPAGPALLQAQLSWLQAVAAHARQEAARGALGIFGTSNAATWLAQSLGNAVGFFVDEDPQRCGNTHLDRPIVAPGDVPPDSSAYLAFPREVAEDIAKRLAGKHPGLRLILPPAAA